MTDINKTIINEISNLTEDQKKDVLEYVKTFKRPTKGINPFIGFCENEPELIDLMMKDVVESRNVQRRCSNE